jgi:hypothetical protein
MDCRLGVCHRMRPPMCSPASGHNPTKRTCTPHLHPVPYCAPNASSTSRGTSWARAMTDHVRILTAPTLLVTIVWMSLMSPAWYITRFSAAMRANGLSTRPGVEHVSQDKRNHAHLAPCIPNMCLLDVSSGRKTAVHWWNERCPTSTCAGPQMLPIAQRCLVRLLCIDRKSGMAPCWLRTQGQVRLGSHRQGVRSEAG